MVDSLFENHGQHFLLSPNIFRTKLAELCAALPPVSDEICAYRTPALRGTKATQLMSFGVLAVKPRFGEPVSLLDVLSGLLLAKPLALAKFAACMLEHALMSFGVVR